MSRKPLSVQAQQDRLRRKRREAGEVLTIFRKPIRSRFLRSFLYYVPYVCLTAMTFPAILSSTASVISGAAALAVAILLAYRGKSLIVVALSSSAAVLIVEFILKMLGVLA